MNILWLCLIVFYLASFLLYRILAQTCAICEQFILPNKVFFYSFYYYIFNFADIFYIMFNIWYNIPYIYCINDHVWNSDLFFYVHRVQMRLCEWCPWEKATTWPVMKEKATFNHCSVWRNNNDSFFMFFVPLYCC